MNLRKTLTILAGILCLSMTWIAIAATSSGKLRVNIVVSLDNMPVTSPQMVVDIGKQAEMTVNARGTNYRFRIFPKYSVDVGSVSTVLVQTEIAQRQKNAWKVIASPELMASLDKPVSSTVRLPGSATQPATSLSISVSSANGTANVDLLKGSKQVDRNSPFLLGGINPNRICETCGSGAELCCSNACCSDSANGCGQICDP